MTRPIAGIFVGGRATRMGGERKGLLRGPDGRTLVARLQAAAEPTADIVLVGEASAYAGLGLTALADAPAGIGPLGGLIALLRYAQARPGPATALAIACDMPRVSPRLVGVLSAWPAEACVVAPRRDGRWEPLCARYAVDPVLRLAEARAARGVLSLQGLLDEAQAVALPPELYDPSELRDWDRPEDIDGP